MSTTLYRHTEPPARAATGSPAASGDLRSVVEFVRRHTPLFVLTGAGISTPSGIPDYRDAAGEWKHPKPVQYQDFMRRPEIRRHYWSRSMLGWPRIDNARANPAHRALAALQTGGVISQLVTQNVDGLHHRAGHSGVIELHGSLAEVRCMGCGRRYRRSRIQARLEQDNPGMTRREARIAPDGDARLEPVDAPRFKIPDCGQCGGILKPDVVFFGEAVPRPRVDLAFSKLGRARGLLVVGSSLAIYSGFRFCRFAAENDIPMAAINLGRTRADGDFAVKLEMNCVEALSGVLTHLGVRQS